PSFHLKFDSSHGPRSPRASPSRTNTRLRTNIGDGDGFCNASSWRSVECEGKDKIQLARHLLHVPPERSGTVPARKLAQSPLVSPALSVQIYRTTSNTDGSRPMPSD